MMRSRVALLLRSGTEYTDEQANEPIIAHRGPRVEERLRSVELLAEAHIG